MQDYNFVLIHWLGKQNGKADYLSRWAGHETGVNDNSDVILLKSDHFRSLPSESTDAIIKIGAKSNARLQSHVINSEFIFDLNLHEPVWRLWLYQEAPISAITHVVNLDVSQNSKNSKH